MLTLQSFICKPVPRNWEYILFVQELLTFFGKSQTSLHEKGNNFACSFKELRLQVSMHMCQPAPNLDVYLLRLKAGGRGGSKGNPGLTHSRLPLRNQIILYFHQVYQSYGAEENF